MTIYCAWELRWRRDSTGGRWGEVWSPWKEEDPGRTHPRRREEALNTAFPLFLPWASWVSQSSLGWCHVTVQASPISMTITEVLAPLPRPACVPRSVIAHTGLRGCIPPLGGSPGDSRVEAPQLKHLLLESHSPTLPIFNPRKLQPRPCGDQVDRSMTSWVPGLRGCRKTTIFSLSFTKPPGGPLPSSPLYLFIPPFFLPSPPFLPLFRLEWIRHPDLQRGLRIAQVGSLESWPFKNAPAQEESWGNNSQARFSVFYTALHKTRPSTWAFGLQAERWAWPRPGGLVPPEEQRVGTGKRSEIDGKTQVVQYKTGWEGKK